MGPKSVPHGGPFFGAGSQATFPARFQAQGGGSVQGGTASEPPSQRVTLWAKIWALLKENIGGEVHQVALAAQRRGQRTPNATPIAYKSNVGFQMTPSAHEYALHGVLDFFGAKGLLQRKRNKITTAWGPISAEELREKRPLAPKKTKRKPPQNQRFPL